MKTFISVVLVGAISILFARAQEDIPAKAAKAAATAAETAKHVGQAAVRHTKEAVETVTDVFTPEPGARRVDVTLSDYHIAMPGAPRARQDGVCREERGQQKT